MRTEKIIEKVKKHIGHVFGGFLMGMGLFYLFTFKESSETFDMVNRFAMFVLLFLLGLSYLGD